MNDSRLTNFQVFCRSGRYSLVRNFIDCFGYDVNRCIVPETGDTPLHLAIAGLHGDVVELLLRRGADPNAANYRGTTPLHMICVGFHHFAMLKKFVRICEKIEKTMLPDALDSAGCSPLHLALHHGHVGMVRLMLEIGADPDLVWLGKTPLHLICLWHGYDLAETLFDVGDDTLRTITIDARDENGDTPLHYAARSKHYTVTMLVELLLNEGGSLNDVNNAGKTPLHLMLDRSPEAFYDRGLLELVYTICHKLNLSIDQDMPDHQGRTVIHLALYNENLIAAEFLLSMAVDPNAVDEHGFTPLHLICKNKKFKAEFLRKFFLMNEDFLDPVNKDELDNMGRTPYQWAIARVAPSIINILSDNGADQSNSTFPSKAHFDECLEPEDIIACEDDGVARPRSARSCAEAIIECLERMIREREDGSAMAIVKWLAELGLFEVSTKKNDFFLLPAYTFVYMYFDEECRLREQARHAMITRIGGVLWRRFCRPLATLSMDVLCEMPRDCAEIVCLGLFNEEVGSALLTKLPPRYHV